MDSARFLASVRKVGHNPGPEVSAHNDIDCFVVEAAPLATVLHGFVAARPHQATTAWLVAEAGVPKWQIDNLLYRDPATQESRPRRRRIELRHADRIVTAIDRTELLYDGTLEPIPNPAIARRTWSSCCGGSLTGVVTR